MYCPICGRFISHVKPERLEDETITWLAWSCPFWDEHHKRIVTPVKPSVSNDIFSNLEKSPELQAYLDKHDPAKHPGPLGYTHCQECGKPREPECLEPKYCLACAWRDHH